MRDDCVSCGCTEENRRYLPSSVTEVYVLAGGWPTTFTTNMGGVDVPVTGENTTTSFDVNAGDATRTDMNTKGMNDE